MGKGGNVVGYLVSVILVVGVVLGVVAVVQRGNSNDYIGNQRGGGHISTSTKTLASTKMFDSFCAHSIFKDECALSLQSLADLPNPPLKDYLSAILSSTLVELRISIEIIGKVTINKDDDPYNDQMGIDDCNEFLSYAVDQLEDAISSIGDGQIQTLQDRAEEFIAWLTGANVYQTTCVDQITKPQYKIPVQFALQKTAHLISNGIYIFSKIENIAKIFDIEGLLGIGLHNDAQSSGPSGLDNDTQSSGPSGLDKDAQSLRPSGLDNDAQSSGPSGLDKLGNIATSTASAGLGLPGDTSKSSASLNTKGGTGVGNDANPQPNDDSSIVSRRLHDTEGGRSGYPSWVTTTDRRLLQEGGARPNAIVANDGSGQFRTINDAINSIPKAKKGAQQGRFVIYVKAGIYNEIVLIKKKSNVLIYGDGQGKTIITGDLSVALKRVKTSNSATVGVDADGFMIRSVTIRNTAGPDGHQAVALRIAGEYAVVFDCSIEAYQDTLYYHRGQQFYKNCVISGTVDFIFGNGKTIIQDSLLIVRKPNPSQSNMITADGGLTPQGEHGLVIQNCKITAENELMAAKAQFKTYLGRPWKAYALTVFMQSEIGDFIAPEGYSIFTNVGEGATNQQTAIYGEYQNIGPGANTDRRDRITFRNWQLLRPEQAQQYTIGSFLAGGAWLSNTGVPYKLGL